jgi:hypothetical protein
MNTTTEKPNKVLVLQLCNQGYFVSKFLGALPRTLAKSLDGYFIGACQQSLHDFVTQNYTVLLVVYITIKVKTVASTL